MRGVLKRAVLLLGIGVAGCTDAVTAPTAVSRIPSPRPDEVAGDPPEPWPVAITDHYAETELPVQFSGMTWPANAWVRGTMAYDAYHGRISATATLRDDAQTTQRTFAPQEQHTFWSYSNTLTAEWPILVSKSCGTILEADVTYEAWWRGIGGGGAELVLDRAVAEDSPQSSQPRCGDCKPDNTIQPVVYEPGYDPYADPTNCGGGGGSGGSGKQYAPGDYTGGETVDWGTGIGNGGTSACGENAVVDYVCIDYWDGTAWVNWGCGYVTTC